MKVQKDKIFNNTFEESGFEMDPSFSFEIATNYVDSRNEEEKIENSMIINRIHELIEVSRFKDFNNITEFNQTIKLKKSDINEIYEYVSEELRKNHGIIEIFSEVCDYFNINPTKFYQSLGNKFKEELIEALDKKTNVLKKKNINRLF